MLLKSVTQEVKSFFLSIWSYSSVKRQKEILHLKGRLEEFDIQFSNLVFRPSGIETRTLMKVSKTVAQNNELLDKLCSERKIAVQQLATDCGGISPKMLEEHHEFIVTIAHILGGPYPCLKEYIRSNIT